MQQCKKRDDRTVPCCYVSGHRGECLFVAPGSYDASHEIRLRRAIDVREDEIEVLRAENDRMRPVYDAALVWAKEEDLDDFPALKAMRFTPSERDLVIAVMRSLGMTVSEELIKLATKDPTP